jgi:S1-C subfamily serine protease
MFLVSPVTAHEDPAVAELDDARNHLIEDVGDTVYDISVIVTVREKHMVLEKKMAKGTGSGITKDGYILTAGHVARFGSPQSEYAYQLMLQNGLIWERTYILRNRNDESFKAVLVDYHEANDLALLKIVDSKRKIFPHNEWGPVELKHDSIVIIGSPLGLKDIVSTGIISRPKIRIKSPFSDRFYFVTDASTHPGSSGAPVFLLRNHTLAGVIVEVFSPGSQHGNSFGVGVNLGIPAVTAKSFVDATLRNIELGRHTTPPY